MRPSFIVTGEWAARATRIVKAALSDVPELVDDSAGSAPTPDGLPQAAKQVAPIARNFGVRMRTLIGDIQSSYESGSVSARLASALCAFH
jgi:hypothetical protein